jgi:MFS family permease
MTGLGLGPLLAGLFAEYVAMPTRGVFWAYLAVCALTVAALPLIPETVRNHDRAIRLRPRIGVPPGMRAVMLGAGLGVFAAFTVLGLFSSLVPTFLHGTLGVHNLALIGGASFLIFISVAPSNARLGYWRNATLSSVRCPYRLSGMMMTAALSTRRRCPCRR